MSIRASIISFILRQTIKKQFAEMADLDALREDLGLTPAAPEEVITQTIDAGGVKAEWVIWPGCADDSVLLYLHGGGYVFGGPNSHRDLVWRLAKGTGLKALLVDYRLAPEHPFPAAVDDATASYRWLLDQGIDPDRIAIAGDSAGGGLAAALMVNLKNLGVALPRAAVFISPWADLTMGGKSMQTNAKADAMLSPEAMDKFAAHYLGDTNPKAPLASPVFADLSGFPPVLVVVGSTEILLSDSETLVEKINATGGNARLTVWPKMFHVFPLMAARIPEGKQAVSDISAFLCDHLGTRELT